MLDYLFKLLGVNTDSRGEISDEMAQRMMGQSKIQVEKGRELADECVEEGLKQGEFTRLSSVERNFKKEYPLDYKYVLDGFKARMLELSSSGEVIAVNIEENDVAFVHKDFEEKYQDHFS